MTKKAKKKSAKKPAAKKKVAVTIKRKPRAQRLPGMEDAGIKELENIAEDMADVISQKKELIASEKNLNEMLVAAMKKHGKTTYSHRGITINLSATEKAKVTIKEEGELDDTQGDNEPAPAPNVNEDSLAVHAE